MKRERQSPDDEVENLPSTTRAVAWGALFFALLSFLMSGATLLLTYKDGRLVGNLNSLMHEARQTIDKTRQKSAGGELEAQQTRVREQLNRYIKMIQQGDSQARYYLENLRGDLDRLKDYASKDGGKWIGDAATTIESARKELQSNTPAAVGKLRDLSSRLGAAVETVRGSKPAPPAKPEADTP